MERIIAAVMCAGLVLLLFVGLGWADTQVIINPLQDTYVNINHTSSKTNLSDTNHSEETVINLGQGVGGNSICDGSGHCGFWLFNMSVINGKIIKPTGSVLWNWTKESGYTGTSGGYTRLSILANSSWNGSFVNGTGQTYYPNVSMNMTYIFGGAHDIDLHTFEPSKNLTLASSVLGYFYNSTTLTIASDGYQNVGSDVYTKVYSIEDGSNRGVKLTFFNLTDYFSGNISITDLTGFCLDFESGSYNDNATSVSDCTGTTWDFFYDLTTNKITPIEPIAFAGRTTADSNASLGYLDCNLFGPSAYTYNQYSNANPPSTPKLYDMFCFNQSYVHAVKGFYGAIKIINNTNVRYSLECPLNDCHDLDLYWAIYSPAFATFSLPVLQPDPPIGGVNLTVQWTTTIPMYGGVYFRYNASGNMSSYFTIYDSNLSYRNYHSVVIPASYILSYKYEYYLIGNSSTGTNYTSIMFNFTALGVTEIVTENTTIAGPDGALQRLVDNGFVENYEQAKWFLGGLVLLILGGFSVYFGGMKIGITSIALLALALGTVGLLPGYVMAPIIFLAAVVVVSFLSGVFT